jgi:hypothetical protein
MRGEERDEGERVWRVSGRGGTRVRVGAGILFHSDDVVGLGPVRRRAGRRNARVDDENL